MGQSNKGNIEVQALRVVQSGVLTVQVEQGETIHIGELAHNLGYTPMIFVYLRDEVNNYQQIPMQLFFPTFIDNYRCGSNRNTLWVRIDMDSAAPVDTTQYFYYFLMNQSLNVFDGL